MANDKANVDSVATSIDDVIDCSENMEAIKDAPTQAANAAASAEDAAASAASVDAQTLLHKTGDESIIRGTVYTEVSVLPVEPDEDMIYLIPE